MPGKWLTWASLGVDAVERESLRKAGLAAPDVGAMHPLDLVAATDEVVTEERADELCRRASLLQLFTPARTSLLELLGVRDREDLASRTPMALFDTWQDVSPYTRPNAYKLVADCITAAGGPPFPIPDDAELVRRAWTYRYGSGGEPRATTLRIRIPALKLNAPVVVTGASDDGVPKPPLHPHHVAIAGDDRRIAVGHWQWGGHFAAFLRLEHLEAGDPVEIVDGRAVIATYFVTEVVRGPAPIPARRATGALSLMTPPHLRWPPWIEDWDLPGDLDRGRTWVQVRVGADGA